MESRDLRIYILLSRNLVRRSFDFAYASLRMTQRDVILYKAVVFLLTPLSTLHSPHAHDGFLFTFSPISYRIGPKEGLTYAYV